MAAKRLAVSNGVIRLLGALGLGLALAIGLSGGIALAKQGTATEAKVELKEMNGSGVTGFASLVAKGKRTQVSMNVKGVLGDNPTHIHQGTCSDLDPNPQYPLTNIVLPSSTLTGTSDTLVDVPLADLLSSPHLILVHKSQKDIGTYLACGDIVPGALTAEQKAQAAGGSPMPNTGVGLGSPGSLTGRTAWLALVATELIVVSALIVVRRAPVFAPRKE
jgi:hypothetical protein